MKRYTLLAITILMVLAFSPSLGADQEAKEILQAVVKVKATIPKEAHSARTLGTEREGSGVVIDQKGHILTVGYLIIEAERIEVIGPEDKPISATFVGYDHATGFGLLRTEKPLSVKPMKFGQSSKVKEGEPVLVAGYGGEEAVQAVRIISKKEFAGYWEYLLEEAFYTAPAYANFGGAALIDREGQLVGIGSLFSQVTILGFGSIPCNIFVPIDLLPPILNDLITKGRSQKPPRPWLGINVEEAHGRVFVTRVTSEGPAEKAGLKSGDLVLAVKGEEVKGLADLYRRIWALGQAGVDVPLTLLQGMEIRELAIRSSDRYQFLRLAPKKIL